MIIQKIEIENFGAFHQFSLEPRTNGIISITGENEFGKTTLLEFLRRMFKGFPDRRFGGNPYPQLHEGGRYGGRLTMQTGAGEDVIFERFGKSNGGDLKIRFADGRESDSPEELEKLLGCDGVFYCNIYAITLDELASLKPLDLPEVRSRLYGANLLLGGAELTGLGKQLGERNAALFQPHGRKDRLHQLGNEFKSAIAEYDQRQQNAGNYAENAARGENAEMELRRLREELQTLENEAAALVQKQQEFSHLRREQDTLERQLAALRPVPVPAAGDSEIAALERELENRRRLEQQRSKQENARDELAAQLLTEKQKGTALSSSLGFPAALLAAAGAGCLISIWFALLGIPAILLFWRFFLRRGEFKGKFAALNAQFHDLDEEVTRLQIRCAGFSPLPDPEKLRSELREYRDWEVRSGMLHAQREKLREQMVPFHPDEMEKRHQRVAADLQEKRTAVEECVRISEAAAQECRRLLADAEQNTAQTNQLESMKTELHRTAENYLTGCAMSFLLDRTIHIYELERQPEVISRAAELFEKFTAGRYPKMRKSLTDSELYLQDTVSGREKTITELSRGTLELLLLSMRLALIECHEKEAEPLPVFLDDSLVNLDPKRRAAFRSTLEEFSQNRQIFLTATN